MEPQELRTRAIIAAAIIESKQVGIGIAEKELGKPWTEHEQLVRLNRLIQLLYDTISSKR